MDAPTAFYPGSFDPPTNGHRDVLEGALCFSARVVVGLGAHPSKTALFDLAEREAMLAELAVGLGAGDRVSVVRFAGLAVDAARAAHARVIVRGLRDGTDFDDEMQMVGMNSLMAPALRTVFVPASASTRMITGTLVRQIAKMGGDVSFFVPALVARRLEARFGRADLSRGVMVSDGRDRPDPSLPSNSGDTP